VAQEKGIRFNVLGKDLQHEVNADSTQIEQVLTNLIMNSIQAMPKGGNIEVSIGKEEVSPVKDKGGAARPYLCLKVRDEGVGISKEALEHIFEPFYTTKEGGTGLGLSIVHKIITSHRGQIEVDNRPGEGVGLLLPAGCVRAV
jgi:signal transduction histidine kinase